MPELFKLYNPFHKFGLILLLLLNFGLGFSASSQSNTMKNPTQHPLICDPAQGVCSVADSTETAESGGSPALGKLIKIIYFTDPICSSCWGIEPQLRLLKMEYGELIDIHYHMGGLLPAWEGYNGGGITKASDVYHHWEEVSAYYGMPMVGDVWNNDPLHSSYPPSIAFKAAQLQDQAKAIKFLRRLREQVFVEALNITRWEHITRAAEFAGLDVAKLKRDYEGPASTLLEQDLLLARQMGVRGFPTLFFMNQAGDKNMVYGFKPYTEFEGALKKVLINPKSTPFSGEVLNYLNDYKSLTAKELSIFNQINISEASKQLDSLMSQGLLIKISTRHGDLWRLPD